MSPRPKRIALNLAPGMLTVDDVLGVLKQTVPVEVAAIMIPSPGPDAPAHIPAHDGYRDQLPGIPFTEVTRFDFYDEMKTADGCCVVATGDQRLYANLLLTIGVRQPTE